ncbi:MAG TPA: hypothetical protein VMI54_21590 [Polyangiaceae bacterium]|nr:hypothetical protein [Polyangiaceae bacterium]
MTKKRPKACNGSGAYHRCTHSLLELFRLRALRATLARMGRRLGLVTFALVVACSKKASLEAAPRASALPHPPAAPSHAGAKPSAAPASPAASAAAPPAPAPGTPEAAINRWNALINRADVQGLADVYADSVDFYGQKLPKARVLALKAAAFRKTPDFMQFISELKVTMLSKDVARAEFGKLSTHAGQASDTNAVLELTRSATDFKVSRETDDPTEARKGKAVERCEAAVVNLVINTEPAKSMLAAKTPPDVHMGLRIAGGPPDQPTYAVAVHEDHTDHLATLAWYDIDPKTGSMRDSESEGPPLKVDAALSQRVVAACQ